MNRFSELPISATITLTLSRERRARAVGEHMVETYGTGGRKGTEMPVEKTINSALAFAAVEQHLGIASGSLKKRGYGRA